MNQLEIRTIADDYLKNIGQPRKLGRKWFRGFMLRFKDELVQRKCTNLAANRANAITQECLDDFFKLLKDIYDEKDLHLKPHSVWNCDESGYGCDQGNYKIICHKGLYNPSKLQGFCLKFLNKIL